MDNIEGAIERIKRLECSAGDLKSRVRGILKDYEVANKSEITVSRDHRLDKRGARGYSAKITRDKELDIAVLAVSGMDDYVVKVVDAYLLQ
ncbi:MAG: hypothetical protein H7X79_03455 [Sporomusaceae bacterium]|nr:hypothetical protein [Sporomusaceae bacterium]